ncbi:MAG: xylose isomerase [Oscillospiraceae bacterium]|jgi:xylose isomerase|nr:xylose isomerase [Oscillospiraceae bacterium]
MSDFFPSVPKIAYEGAKSKGALAFHFYNPDEILLGKTMKEHLRFAMSWWHTLCAEGSDMFGSGTLAKNYGQSDPTAYAVAKAEAGFELMQKLGIDFYCFHDRDLAPEAETLAATNARLDVVADKLEALQKGTDIRPLWGTANLFSNPRYQNGAASSCSPEVFAFAAAQVKKALELTVRLGGEGYVFWGGREGYETLLNTNYGLEQENIARLFTMARDYARSIGFKGLFYIEPKPREPMKHQYDYDAATAIGFLRKYGLQDDFRMNIEANHATLAGHTFQHELRVAREEGFFGSIDANIGDPLLGWDTDQFPTNVYDTALAMWEVLEAGGFKLGGLNFDAKARRASNTFEDLFQAYIAGMDSFALGLRVAVKLREDGRLADFVQQRYAGYESGLGAEIVSGKATIRDLETYALKAGDVATTSGKQEYLEAVVNSVMFG